MEMNRREFVKGGLATLGFLALPGGLFAAPEGWMFRGKPDNGVTTVEIPISELPAGTELTIAVRSVSSLGTKGKTIGTTWRT